MDDFFLEHYYLCVDNSKVYLEPGEKPPKGAVVYAGSRKRTARYYKPDKERLTEEFGKGVGSIYVSPEDYAVLNKIQYCDPTLEDIKKRYFSLFPDTPEHILEEYRESYIERGPDLNDEEFDRARRLSTVGLTTYDGNKYVITAEGVNIRSAGVNALDRYHREELIEQHAKSYGYISKGPDYVVDISKGEDHDKMPLTDEEKSALLGYKGSLFQEINPALLGSGNLKMNLHRIANLDSLLSRSVISSPITTYNGTSSRIGEMLMAMAPGDQFQIDTFLSTSLSRGTAAWFAADSGGYRDRVSNVLLEIALPAGTHGYYFGENDMVSHPEGDQFGGSEREILLPRASQFRLESIEKDEVGSDVYRNQYIVKATLILPPKKEEMQADFSRVYLKDGEEPPKGARLHKGTRKPTARWYESQEYKKHLTNGGDFTHTVLSAVKKLRGKYAEQGSYEKKNLHILLRKIKDTYSMRQFIGAMNREFYVENSPYNMNSYGEGYALQNILPNMVSTIQEKEPLYAPLQYRSSTYNEVTAFINTKPGDTFISKKWMPLSKDQKSAEDDTMSLFADGVEKIVFKVDASEGMEGVSSEDLLVGKVDQPYQVTDTIMEGKTKIISIKPVTEDKYGELSSLPLGLPRSYYGEKVKALLVQNGSNAVIQTISGNLSNVYDGEKIKLETLFGEHKGEYYLSSEGIRRMQQHQAYQSFNGNWGGEDALEVMDVAKQICDAAPPLKDMTIYLPFDAVQAYKTPQTDEENTYIKDRVNQVESLKEGDTFKIRMNMVGTLNPDTAHAKSTYKYTDNRVAKFGTITYRYKPTGNPDFDKGVVTSGGDILLQRNISWKVVGVHEINDSDIPHKVLDIEPVRGDDTPHYPNGEPQFTKIAPKEFDPGEDAGSNGFYSTSTIDKYDELGIDALEFTGNHHPTYKDNTIEGQAMKSWCSGDYEDISTYIRSGKVTREKLLFPTLDGMDRFTPETIIPHLDKYIETFPPMPEGIILYRGMGAKTAAKMIKNLKVGDTFTDPCYMSFSDNPEVAWKFAKKPESTCDDDPKVFFRLVSKGGEHAALGNFSESEIVFGRNQTLKVVNVSKANFDTLPPDKGGHYQVYPTPVIIYDVEIAE